MRIGAAPRPERATLILLATNAEEAVAIANRIAPAFSANAAIRSASRA